MIRPLAAVLAAASLTTAPAVFAGAPALFLEAQENLDLDSDPTQPSVVFSVRQEDPDAAWNAFGRERREDDLRGVRSWQLALFDSDEKKVSYVQGAGAPPASIEWYGLSAGGRLLPNGFYKARLIWVDETQTARRTPPVTTSLLTFDQVRDFMGPNVTLSHIDAGLVIRIVEGMLFARGQTDIEPASLPLLEKISLFLRSHPRNHVVVMGHTDTQGSRRANARVSTQRARAVYEFLVDKGVDPTLVTYEGRGSDAPIASNATSEGQAKNRRVEILVLKTSG